MRGYPGIFLAFILLLLPACRAQTPASGEVRIGLAQRPMTLDPRYATDAASHRVQDFLHRGLIRLDEHFHPRGDLASHWEHPDPLHWYFFLRKGVRFHNGQRVAASDVAATLQSILDPDMASPLRSGFLAIRQVKALSPDEVAIVLDKPDSSLLTRLSIGILPASMAAKKQQDRQIIGCGPFRLLHWNNSGLVLQRLHSSGDPHQISRLRFMPVKDPVTRCLKLTRGEIDFTENDLPPHLLPYLRKQKQLTMKVRTGTTFAYIGLNLRDRILKDVRVRHALALATDRAALKRALFSDLPKLAETVLPPGHWAAAKLPLQPYNPSRAEQLLDSAGFPRGKDGIRFSINYRTSTNPTRLSLATAIADQWRRIGIDVHIESLEWGGFYARIKRGDFQVFSLSWVGIVDPDIYRWILDSKMWPPAGANRGRYANAKVDRWLDEAERSENEAQRAELYRLIQQQMYRDQVYIPLWYEPVIAVSGPRLHGFVPRPDGSMLGLLQAHLK